LPRASALFPFTALYYQSIGLNGGQIGMLTGMAPLITWIGARCGQELRTRRTGTGSF
jgi:hypothetical protein